MQCSWELGTLPVGTHTGLATGSGASGAGVGQANGGGGLL